MNADQIRQKYLDFFKDKGHTIIPRANIVPQDDPTTLFTVGGMQPLIPYLLGQTHPAGTRLTDVQTCFRADDIDEIGDNRHTSLFEMLGNWSLGDYFKAEQIPWFWEFLTGQVKLDPARIFVTCFIGDEQAGVPKDTESAEIWQGIFKDADLEYAAVEIGSEADGAKRGIKDGERIFYYDAKKNWWSRAGTPSEMPEGEPGGPDTEAFYVFPGVEHDKAYGQLCHPNCDCGRFIELGNSVFMEYIKTDQGIKKLPNRNVDYGGGLERIAAAANDDPDMFKISVLWPIVQKVEELSSKKYTEHTEAQRIIADHMRGAVFMACDGVNPSNTGQGYVLRRLLRRAIRRGHELGINEGLIHEVAPVVADIFRQAYPEVIKNEHQVIDVLEKEEKVFRQTLKKGLLIFEKTAQLNQSDNGEVLIMGKFIFMMFDTYGFPAELVLEEAAKQGWQIEENWQKHFDTELENQRERSRTASAGMFKGGLADHSEQTVKYHTATHLMYKALRTVLGDHVVQRGSNVTSERLRFDFSHPAKMTPEEIAKVEEIVNDAISADYPVNFKEISTDQAVKKGAFGAFGDKYGDKVKVYTVGKPGEEPFSYEICGGPHVEHSGVLSAGGKRFKILKEEASSAGVRRIKAVLE